MWSKRITEKVLDTLVLCSYIKSVRYLGQGSPPRALVQPVLQWHPEDLIFYYPEKQRGKKGTASLWEECPDLFCVWMCKLQQMMHLAIMFFAYISRNNNSQTANISLNSHQTAACHMVTQQGGSRKREERMTLPMGRYMPLKLTASFFF